MDTVVAYVCAGAAAGVGTVGVGALVLRSSGVLARCCARARRVTPNGPLDGPKTYKLPADKGPLCLVPERRAALTPPHRMLNALCRVAPNLEASCRRPRVTIKYYTQ